MAWPWFRCNGRGERPSADESNLNCWSSRSTKQTPLPQSLRWANGIGAWKIRLDVDCQIFLEAELERKCHVAIDGHGDAGGLIRPRKMAKSVDYGYELFSMAA